MPAEFHRELEVGDDRRSTGKRIGYPEVVGDGRNVVHPQDQARVFEE